MSDKEALPVVAWTHESWLRSSDGAGHYVTRPHESFPLELVRADDAAAALAQRDAEIAALREQVEALKADSVRIDWLEQQYMDACEVHALVVMWRTADGKRHPEGLRAALDAALAAGQAAAPPRQDEGEIPRR